jgi:branched-chain amino acid transport system permease protein
LQVIIQNIIDALSLGSLFALTALGISLVFGIMRLVNFAHGDFISLGAYALIVPSASPTAIMYIGNWPALATIVAICAILILIAIVCERVAFKPLRGADPSVLMIASFAVSYFIQNAIIMIYGGRSKGVDLWPFLQVQVPVGGIRLQLLQLVTIASTIILLGLLTLFLHKLPIGRQMRAASENFTMARLLGVRANFVIAAAFGVSGFLAAVVSLLYVVQRGTLAYDVGAPLVMAGFVATVIGGMGSVFGAVLGGFFVGITNVFFQVMLPVSIRADRDAFVFAFVILILLIRPSGLIKVKSVEERV